MALAEILIHLDGQVIKRISGGVLSTRQEQVFLGVVFAWSGGVWSGKETQNLPRDGIDASVRNNIVRKWRPVKDAFAVVGARRRIVDNVRAPGSVHQFREIAVTHIERGHGEH